MSTDSERPFAKGQSPRHGKRTLRGLDSGTVFRATPLVEVREIAHRGLDWERKSRPVQRKVNCASRAGYQFAQPIGARTQSPRAERSQPELAAQHAQRIRLSHFRSDRLPCCQSAQRTSIARRSKTPPTRHNRRRLSRHPEHERYPRLSGPILKTAQGLTCVGFSTGLQSMQHFLNFRPLPHGHGSLRPILGLVPSGPGRVNEPCPGKALIT